MTHGRRPKLGLRRQLPAYSPIRSASLAAGLLGAFGLGNPRKSLRVRLEQEFGTRHVLLTDSGTTALRLAIRGALEVRDSDIVALPAFCCYDVATAALGAGGRVRLYDVDPLTLGPDWESLTAVLRAGVGVAVVAHLYGLPVDMARAATLTEAHSVLLIEDAAQGYGGSLDGRPLGAFGSLAVLSFGRGKGITGGGGGALLANDEAGRGVLRAARRSLDRGRGGWTEWLALSMQWLFGRPSWYGLPASLPWLGLGETRYHEPWPPRFIARSAAAAVLANWQASLVEARRRAENASFLAEVAPRSPILRAPIAAEPAPLRLPILVDENLGTGRERTSFLTASRTSLGFASGYPKSLDAIPALQPALVSGPACPGAHRLSRRLITAPIHGLVDPEVVRSALSSTGAELE